MTGDACDEASPVSTEEAASLLDPYRSGGRGLVLAVSGGPDSVALMRLAAQRFQQFEAPDAALTVATVDHGLRQESRGEAQTVGGWAEECGLSHRIVTWEAEKPAGRIQEAAREARYSLLTSVAREIGASHVVTAHTLDDQAETLVMRMARGTGIAGLGGMRQEIERDSIVVARPFLGLRKERLRATCLAHEWPYLEDPSNRDPRFARARLRGTVMPLLAEEGITPERLGALAVRAQRAEDALAIRAAAVLAAARTSRGEDRIELDSRLLLDEPDAIFLRVVARAIAAVAGPGAPAPRLERFERHVLRELRPALETGAHLRLTLGGALIEAQAGCRLILRPELPRRTAKA